LARPCFAAERQPYSTVSDGIPSRLANAAAVRPDDSQRDNSSARSGSVYCRRAAAGLGLGPAWPWGQASPEPGRCVLLLFNIAPPLRLLPV